MDLPRRLMEVDSYNFVSGFKTVHFGVATHNALLRIRAAACKTRAQRSASEMRLCHVTTIDDLSYLDWARNDSASDNAGALARRRMLAVHQGAHCAVVVTSDKSSVVAAVDHMSTDCNWSPRFPVV